MPYLIVDTQKQMEGIKKTQKNHLTKTYQYTKCTLLLKKNPQLELVQLSERTRDKTSRTLSVSQKHSSYQKPPQPSNNKGFLT